ncbi:MAG: DUF2029 domain-containing protein, partial [Chloroflexota bacterium]|nr:DUF2029 domain-containing protein [Chloroflexota bacterium]
MRRTVAAYQIVGMSAFAMSLAFGITLLLSRPVGFDFAAYLLAARRLLAGQELYPSSEQLVIGPFGLFLYPPPVALLFVPFAGLPTDMSRALWLGAGIALGVVLGVWCMRGKSTEDRWYTGAAAALFFPLLWEIQLGNLTLLTTVLCLFAHRLRERPATAGTFLALAIGLKLLPLTLLVFFIAAGRWRVTLWAALVSVAAVIVTWPFVGHEWSEFVRVLATISSSGPAEGPN